MKITRKLTISIVCLVLSLAFCVWAVLAWFAANSEADAAGMNISVSSDDLGIGLLVYPLEQTGENSYVIKKGADGNPVQGSTSLNMPAYTAGECTAVLIAITVSNSAADMQYSDVPISLSCSGGAQLGAYSAAENKFSCAISNAVTVWSADTTAGGETEDRGDDVYSKKSNSETEPGNEQSFVYAAAQPVKKQSVLQLSPLIEIDAYPDKVTANYIMDYSPELMSWLYGLALGALGAGSDSPALTASIDFADDLTFNIGSGTGTEVCEHVWTYAQLDQTAANYSTHHNAVCSKCGETQEQEHDWSEWTEPVNGQHSRSCTLCGQTETQPVVTEHNYSFTMSNLEEALGGSPADHTLLTAEAIASASSGFITLILPEGISENDEYRTQSGGCIELRDNQLQVEFQGTGTITVYARSTSAENVSDIGLQDEQGNWITATYQSSNVGTTTAGYYTVTGTDFIELTFNISEAGKYYIVNPQNSNRAVRINEIKMTDNY